MREPGVLVTDPELATLRRHLRRERAPRPEAESIAERLARALEDPFLVAASAVAIGMRSGSGPTVGLGAS